MFDLMVWTVINAFWFTLIGGTLTLFTLRLIYALKHQYNLKDRLLICLLPLSIGYYLFEKEKTVYGKVYRSLVVLFFITGVIAFLYVIYTELELMLLV